MEENNKINAEAVENKENCVTEDNSKLSEEELEKAAGGIPFTAAWVDGDYSQGKRFA